MANEQIGVRDTLNINIAEAIRDVDTRVALLEPDRANLIVLIDDLGSREVHKTDFEWQEDDYVDEDIEVSQTGGIDAIAVLIQLASSIMIVIGDMIIVPRTKEIMRVIANNPNTGVITVVRNVNGGAAQGLGQALLDGEQLFIFSNSYEEGHASPQSVTTQVQLPWNYIQIIRNDVALTYSQEQTDTYKGKDFPYLRKKRFTEHLLRLEKTTLLGRRGITPAGLVAGRPERYTGGMEEFITNITAIPGGVITELAWDAWLRGLFTMGSRRKMILCGSIYISAVNQWAKNTLRISLDAKKYGLNIYKYVTPYGDALLARTELLRNNIYSGYAFGLDLAYIRKVHQQGLNTQKRKIVQTAGQEITEEEIVTHYGVERKFADAHALCTGVTGYV